MYICSRFKIHELVYPELYNEYKKKDRLDLLWLAFDDRFLMTIDDLANHYGVPVIINNWFTGGNFSESGLRNMTTSTGAALSQHKFGRGGDLKFPGDMGKPNGLTAEMVRSDMKKLGCFDNYIRADIDKSDPRYPFRHITAIEWYSNNKPITWFHFDTRNNGTNPIKIINV